MGRSFCPSLSGKGRQGSLGAAAHAADKVGNCVSGLDFAIRDEFTRCGVIEFDVLFCPFARVCHRRAQRVCDNV